MTRFGYPCMINVMYCDKCGADNSETAVFCRKCGVAIEHEIETRVAVREQVAGLVEQVRGNVESSVGSVGEETEIFSISPTLMFVKVGYVLAAVSALLMVAILSIFSIPAIVSVPLGLALFLIPGFYHVKQRLVRYTLTDNKVEIDSGFVARTTQNIPIRRIQDVTVTTSIPQRLLGFGDLVIDNASDQAGKVVLKNINTPQKYADILLKQMRLLEK